MYIIFCEYIWNQCLSFALIGAVMSPVGEISFVAVLWSVTGKRLALNFRRGSVPSGISDNTSWTQPERWYKNGFVNAQKFYEFLKQVS